MRIETERLLLREPDAHDAEFLLELLNEPSFLHFIGDRGVRTLEQAQDYLDGRVLPHIRRHGFGALVAEKRDDGDRIGLCTLIRRPTLPDVDIGFAFLPRAWGVGYAFEGSRALLDHACTTLGFRRVVAIASPDNLRSARLLEKLGLRFEGMVRLEPLSNELCLYATS